MSPQDTHSLLKAVQGHRLEALVTVALATGLRRGELLGLRWGDVDLENGTVKVRQALQRVEGRLVLAPPKSDRARRSIVLPRAVIAVLRQHRTSQQQDRLLLPDEWPDSGFVFTTSRGTPIGGSNLNRSFRRILRDAGLPHMRFHDLRHACASFMLSQGASMRVVMEQLGHTQISLTMNTYTHVPDSALKEAAERMDEMLTTHRSARRDTV